ncbi:ricin-type beta-trefoil lectin domain protein [Kitasatospora sp. NPDC057965]|uniref:ricin-type beta-trefoil lectin domain protein n=1 Tax=Kitasatospora sp. NPDC057965 TaxID=3346291 RepID=UPI0036DBB9B7
MLDAITTAKSTGKPVVIEAMTTETSRTVANPDGTLTTTDNSAPVRTKKSGTWADLDATLRANPDGTLTPAVSSTPLTFSGGGSGPMATLSTEDGKKLSFDAPFTLPKPTLNGATATYPDVLPGVDLQLTALTDGGWRDVIVVRTTEAAASPALKTLRFPIKAAGLNVSTTDSGDVEVKDDQGTVRFHSSPALQWDSSRPAPTAAPAKSAATGRSAAARNDPDAPPPPPASTADGPGVGANVAAITTAVTNGALELTPDQAALGSGTGPWYLDPTFTAAASYSEGSVQVQEAYKTARNYDKKTNLATGYCGYHSSNPQLNCDVEGRERAYFKIRINPILSTTPNGAQFPPTIYTAALNGQVSEASSPGTPTDLGVYSAPQSRTIGETSDWNNQPCGTNGNIVMEGCDYVGTQRVTGTGPLAVDVTGWIQRAAAEKWQIWTIGIAPQATEWEKLYRHKIASNPSIASTYDITPTVWYPRTSPGPGFAHDRTTAECTSGGVRPWDNPGWVGNNLNISLIANTWSPTGQSVYTRFHMWDDNDSNFALVNGGWGGSYNDPGYTLPVSSLADGHQYGWYAEAFDGALTSPMSAGCYFRVDRTNPRLSISSTDFPPSGTPNDHPTRYANDTNPATFYVNAEDPAPGAGLQASGIACVRFSSDPTPVVGWQCGQSGTYGPGAPVQFTPTRWGTNTVYAWAMDVAGNYSQRADYNFYAPWKPNSVPTFGDTDGDRIPDIVIPDAAGNLRTLSGNNDPARAITATGVSAPRKDVNDTTTSWADYQVTHRGTLNESGNLDQLIAHNTRDTELKKYLYLIDNDGTGRYDIYQKSTLTRQKATACAAVPASGLTCPASRPFATDWSEISQMVAIGTPDGELTSGDPEAPTDPTKVKIISQTSVLTVEGGRLWLHDASELKWNDVNSPALLIPTAPNSGSWDDYDLINPGAANGLTKTPGFEDANQATLWARHRATGDVFAYPITRATDGKSDFSALTKPNSGRPILLGTGITANSHPKIGAADFNGDGYADLWVIDNTAAIAIFPGYGTGTPGKVDGFSNYSLMGYANTSVSVHSNQVSWQCVDAEGGPRDGAQIAVWNCWDTPNQRVTFGIDGTIRAAGYCLTAQDPSLANGTNVILGICNNQPGQKWATTPDGRIYLPATASATARCLERPGWNANQGTRLGIWDCPGLQANQQWTLNLEPKI